MNPYGCWCLLPCVCSALRTLPVLHRLCVFVFFFFFWFVFSISSYFEHRAVLSPVQLVRALWPPSGFPEGDWGGRSAIAGRKHPFWKPGTWWWVRVSNDLLCALIRTEEWSFWMDSDACGFESGRPGATGESVSLWRGRWGQAAHIFLHFPFLPATLARKMFLVVYLFPVYFVTSPYIPRAWGFTEL